MRSLPAPSPAAVSEGKELTSTDSALPSLASVYKGASAVAAPAFKAPTPPGLKVEWFPALEEVPYNPDTFFPMYNASARVVSKI